jgi:uncharacterized protein (DUF1778 family)
MSALENEKKGTARSACSAEEYELLNPNHFLFDDQGWQKLQEALDRPAKVKPKLKKLMMEKAPWE